MTPSDLSLSALQDLALDFYAGSDVARMSVSELRHAVSLRLNAGHLVPGDLVEAYENNRDDE